MNLLINYDAINAIKDVQEGFTISKLYRNNKKIIYRLCPFICASYYMFFKEDAFKLISFQMIDITVSMVLINLVGYKLVGDVYKEKSEDRLKKLVSLLGTINIDTTYNLLQETSCYHHVYNLKINEDKIPQIVESKYILVPSYDYKGDIVDTSILQEHIIGSDKYVLSIGSPKKVLKLAYNSNG